MKIMLLYPLWSEEYGSMVAHFAKKAGHYPPLNLAYLAALAEKQGCEVRIIDGEAEGILLPELIEKTAEFSPDIVGVTATTPFYHIAVELATKLKERLKNVTIVIGGPHITVVKEKAFNECFDYAFIAEADNSWPQFLEKFRKQEDVTAVRGLLYRENGEIRSTGPSEPLKDVNDVPIPARHLLNMASYTLGTMKGIKNFTSIMTVRGCPFSCIFCSTKVFGKDFRRKDPEKVIREIKDCIEKYGVKHFMFLDDTLTLHRQHIMDICNLIIQEKLDITFEGSTRANLVDEELVERMAKAGLIRLSFGLESADENIRITMKKMVPLESYITANKLTNKYGIETLNSCMIGLPGETRETVKKTLAFLRNSKEIKQANISIAVPYPGTELSEMAKAGQMALRLETENFSEYRRYNAAVMTVGELSPEDLIEIQNEAFASIYLAPWRWEPMIKKSGLTGAALTFRRLVTALKKGDTRYITNEQLGVTESNDVRETPPASTDSQPTISSFMT